MAALRTSTPPVIPALRDIEIDWNQLAPDEEPTAESEIDPRILADARPDTSVPLSTFEAPVMAGTECSNLIEEERSVLAANGIDSSDDGLFFEAGTALADSGHAALAAYDAAYKALPPAATALADFQFTIDSENREDMTLDLANARINAVGRLSHVDSITGVSPNGDAVRGIEIGRTAWRQLTEIAGGQNVNAGLVKRKSALRRVRTRQGDNGREAFGIVSTDPVRGYAVFDGPQVADLMCQALKDRGLLSGAKMTITYDRESTRYDVRAVVQAPVDVPAFAGVGRVHQLFARVQGGDDGMSSIRGGLGALRIRCLNATLVEAKGSEWVKTHRGNASEIRQLVGGMVDHFGAASESLKQVWSRAAANHYLDTDGTQLSVEEALTRLVAHGHIPSGGVEIGEAVDRMMSAWREEDSPASAAGILMAVQRAAHESTWSSKWTTSEMEEAASHLLYQPVWVLDSVEA
jgi:hypothetical protein